MQARLLDSESLTRALKSRQVSHATVNGARDLAIQFTDGTVLHVEAGPLGIRTRVDSKTKSAAENSPKRPTKRQLAYLTFIAKYIRHFDRAPAESDIERHFLVTAPSVNQMMQLLEQRGFIERQPGVPRSIRICIDLGDLGTVGVG